MSKKKFFLSVLLATSFLTAGTPSIIQAQEDDYQKLNAKIQADFDLVNQKFETGELKIVTDKQANVSSKNSTFADIPGEPGGSIYPTRKGVILVTDALAQGTIFGHAGIIYSDSNTIESYIDDGVQMKKNNWNDRYSRLYAVTPMMTTPAQDRAAADWAARQIGKPYNYNLWDIETTDKFYCSQLVYKAFKEAAGVDLNYGNSSTFLPNTLILSPKVHYVYKKGN